MINLKNAGPLFSIEVHIVTFQINEGLDRSEFPLPTGMQIDQQ